MGHHFLSTSQIVFYLKGFNFFYRNGMTNPNSDDIVEGGGSTTNHFLEL